MVTPPTIELGSLGMADSLILMVLALVVFGPRRLPQIGRQIGKLMYEFRKASNDFKYQMEEELRNAEDADRRKKEEERLAALRLAAPAQPAVTLEATVPSSTSVMESQYPAETESPSLTKSETADATTSEETDPLIRPPSTGEQVPAAMPTSPAANLQTAEKAGMEASAQASLDFSPVTEASAIAVDDEVRADETEHARGDPIPAPVQAAHHG